MLCFLFVFVFVLLFRAAAMAYGSSQARDRIRTTAVGLCHSHNNAGSEQCLQSTAEHTATPGVGEDHLLPHSFFFFFFCLFRAEPVAHGGSQARVPVRTVAGLHQSHSSARSELQLRPTPQLTATPDP